MMEKTAFGHNSSMENEPQENGVRPPRAILISKTISIVALSAFLAFLSGCATVTVIPVQPTMQAFDFPKVNEPRTAEVGETTVEKGRVFTFDALELKNQVTGGHGFWVNKVTIPPGVLRETSETSQYRIFISEQATIKYSLPVIAGLAISKSTSPVVMVYEQGYFLTPSEPPQISMTKVNAADSPWFKQEFIYNGRVGDFVKFLYREFAGNLLRAPFNQEVQYDLKESRIIGFKGLRLEIIKASNTRLEYRVLNSFPDK